MSKKDTQFHLSIGFFVRQTIEINQKETIGINVAYIKKQ